MARAGGDLARLDSIVETLELRAYNAAQRGRLTSDWSVSHLDANEELRSGLLTVRAASRNLERNNDLYRKYLWLLVSNVVGDGFELESTPRNARGGVDRTAAKQIESAFRAWAGAPVTLDGRRTLLEEMRLWVRSIARDGEVIVRLHLRDRELRLQTLEADYMPLELHSPRDSTVLGVTVDADVRPLFYWLANTHPGSMFGGGWSRASTHPYPAADVLHAYVTERPGQIRGIPWGTAAFDNLLLLQGYKIAELAAARLAAARPVSIETEIGQDAKFVGDEKTATGDPQVNAEPGGVTILPPGKKLVPLGSDHPKAQYGAFVTEIKRDIAAALGVSYHALNSDLGAANYSSLRHGRADEVRHYRAIQGFLVLVLLRPIFGRWLDYWLASGRSPLPLARRDKFFEHAWHPPAFEPLDPEKDAQGIALELGLGLTTKTDEAKKRGRDFEQLLERRAADDALERKYGVKLLGGPAPAAAPPQSKPKPAAADDAAPKGDGQGDGGDAADSGGDGE